MSCLSYDEPFVSDIIYEIRWSCPNCSLLMASDFIKILLRLYRKPCLKSKENLGCLGPCQLPSGAATEATGRNERRWRAVALSAPHHTPRAPFHVPPRRARHGPPMATTAAALSCSCSPSPSPSSTLLRRTVSAFHRTSDARARRLRLAPLHGTYARPAGPGPTPSSSSYL
jgi:hypothetical protein